MRTAIGVILLCALPLCAPLVQAQDNERRDAEGCKDSPLVARFPGSTINSCENKEFDQYDFPLPPDNDGNAVTQHVEGECQTWDLATRDGASDLQVLRTMEAALKKAAFTIDYESPPSFLTAHKDQGSDVDLHREQRRPLFPDHRHQPGDETGSGCGCIKPER